MAVVSFRSDGAPFHVNITVDTLGINNADRYVVTELFGALVSQELTPKHNLDILVPPTGKSINMLKYSFEVNLFFQELIF